MWTMDQTRILAAAIKLADGEVVSVPQPARHPSVILLCEAQGKSLSGSVQGFVTSEGRFVDRHEAYEIAERARQLIPRPHVVGKLFSEDVW